MLRWLPESVINFVICVCKLFIVNRDKTVSLEMAGRRDYNMEEFWASLPPKIKVLFE